MDIRDIAAKSGYGVGTVSRVINDQPNVSDRARERILAVMAELGYEPNSNARYLKMRSQTPVAVFVMGVGNRMFDDILGPLQAALAREDEQIVVTYLNGDVDEVRAAIDYQQARHPKGMVFLGGELESLRASFHEIETPSVLVTADGYGRPQAISVVRYEAITGQRIDPDECVGTLRQYAFDAVFREFAFWECEHVGDCLLCRLDSEITAGPAQQEPETISEPPTHAVGVDKPLKRCFASKLKESPK